MKKDIKYVHLDQIFNKVIVTVSIDDIESNNKESEKSFLDELNFYMSDILNIANKVKDENIPMTIFSRPDIIDKLEPTEYIYKTLSHIGPVELDYASVVGPNYNFITSENLNKNELTIIVHTKKDKRYE